MCSKSQSQLSTAQITVDSPTSQLALDSDLGHLLRSGNVPSPSDKTKILTLQKSLRQEHRNSRNAFHARLKALKIPLPDASSSRAAWISIKPQLVRQPQAIVKELAQLRKRWEEVEDAVQRRTALLAPIRALPTEVLEHIFLHYHALPRGPFSLCRADYTPLALARVCKEWRALALTMPVLWTNLLLTWDGYDVVSPYPEEWAAQPGAHELTARLEHRERSSDSSSWYTMIRTPSCWTRVRHVTLEFEYVEELGSCLYRLAKYDSLASVESLDAIYHNRRYRRYGLPDTIPLIPLLPPSIHKFGMRSGKWVVGAITPSAHFSHLDLRPIDSIRWRVLIRECPSLQHGVFTINVKRERRFANPDEEARTDSYTAASLELLKIYWVESGQLSLLDGLRFPCLKTLSLGSRWSPRCTITTKWDAVVLNNIQATSLETLELVRINITPEELLAFLRTLPNVTRLLLDLPIEYMFLFKQLACAEREADALLPRLTFLTLYQWNIKAKGRQTVALVAASLIDMVAVRGVLAHAQAQAPLRTAHIYMSSRNPGLPHWRRAILRSARGNMGTNVQVNVAERGYWCKSRYDDIFQGGVYESFDRY